GFSPVSLGAWQTYYGAYFNETFDLTNRLSLTAGGRYNLAAIDMSSLTYARFNPVTGFTYKILPELMTFYAGYSEANRIPTPLELGCSNSLKPCLLEGFLVSDPPLQQVVAKTVEAAFRGNINTGNGRGDWKLGLFHTDSQNDIIQVASVLQGRGVFQNVPLTRRQGLEAGAHFLRYAVDGRQRDTECAERPPHGHAGAAALGLCRPASEAMIASARPSSSCGPFRRGRGWCSAAIERMQNSAPEISVTNTPFAMQP